MQRERRAVAIEFDLDEIRKNEWIKRAAWYCHGYAIRHPGESFDDAWHAWIGYEIDDGPLPTQGVKA